MDLYSFLACTSLQVEVQYPTPLQVKCIVIPSHKKSWTTQQMEELKMAIETNVRTPKYSLLILRERRK